MLHPEPHQPFLAPARFAWVLALLAVLLGAAGCGRLQDGRPAYGFQIVKQGEVLRIYIPRDPDPAERAAAEDMSRVLRLMGAPDVRVRLEPWFTGRPGIYVGDTQMARRRLAAVVAPARDGEPLPPERWDVVGLSVRNGVMVMAGSDARASAMAVYWFLQEQGGVRWWMPGPLGEYIPLRESWELPPMEERYQPSFLSRGFSGLDDPEGRLWALRNLLRLRSHQGHNLQRLVPRELAAAQPGLFPVFNGNAFDPVAAPLLKAHPLLTSHAVVNIVAGAAAGYFDNHPAQAFFSISPDDHLGFGDSAQYGGLVDAAHPFRGFADFSPLVFSFANDVAREVARTSPGRFLGVIAYAAWENVPPFPIEPNLVPVMTADRSQWYDPAFKAQDLALASRWAAKGERLLGTWDYLYGFPYVVPRPLLSTIEESIPELHRRGVRLYYAEMNPIWGFDAPKAWIAARLLWDVHANPKALEREFMQGCYGASAGDMERFFARADALWMRQPPPAQWIKYYENPHQGLLFPPAEVEALRETLEQARERLDENSRERGSVELAIDALRGTAALSEALGPKFAVSAWTPAQPPRALIAAASPWIEARASLERIVRLSSNGDPAAGWTGNTDWLTAEDPLPGRVALLRALLPAAKLGAFERALRATAPEALPASLPPSLLILPRPFDDGLSGWTYDPWPTPATRVSVDDAGALTVRDARTVRLTRPVPVAPGAAYVVALGVTGHVAPESTVRLSLRFVDDEGNVVSNHADRLPPGDADHGLLAVSGQTPQGVHWAYIFIDVNRQEPGDVVRIEGGVPDGLLPGR